MTKISLGIVKSNSCLAIFILFIDLFEIIYIDLFTMRVIEAKTRHVQAIRSEG